LIDRCDHLRDKKKGFLSALVFKDASTVNLDVTLLSRAFPSVTAEVVSRQKDEDINLDHGYSIIMAPYISGESAEQCERLGIGYLDMSGNCRLPFRSIYVNDQGHVGSVDVAIPAALYSGTRRGKHSRHVQGLKAMKAAGGDIAFKFEPRRVKSEAPRPDGAKAKDAYISIS
jgi:hypothetical protein